MQSRHCKRSLCSDTYLGETCRDDNQVEERTSASLTLISNTHYNTGKNLTYFHEHEQHVQTHWYSQWHRLTSLWSEMWSM